MKQIKLLIGILLLISSTLFAQEKNKNKVNPHDNMTEAEMKAQKLNEQSKKLFREATKKYGELNDKADKLRDLERKLNSSESTENDYAELKRKILDLKLELSNAGLETKRKKAIELYRQACELKGKQPEPMYMDVRNFVFLENDIETMQSRVQDKIKEINKIPEKKEVGNVVIDTKTNSNTKLKESTSSSSIDDRFQNLNSIIKSINNSNSFIKRRYKFEIQGNNLVRYAYFNNGEIREIITIDLLNIEEITKAEEGYDYLGDKWSFEIIDNNFLENEQPKLRQRYFAPQISAIKIEEDGRNTVGVNNSKYYKSNFALILGNNPNDNNTVEYEFYNELKKIIDQN